MSDRYPSYEEPRPRSGRGSSFRALRSTPERERRSASIVEGAQDAIGSAVHACICGGIGVLFAATSDGGAVSVTIYDGDDRYRSYASDREEFEKVLEAVRDHGDARSIGPKPTPKPKAR